MVNPTGPDAVTECEFEYGTSPGSSEASVPCSSLPGAVSDAGAGVRRRDGPRSRTPPTTSKSSRPAKKEPAKANRVSFKTESPTHPWPRPGKRAKSSSRARWLEGTVKPEGVPATCEFKWGTSPGSLTKTAPCSPQPGSGTGPEPVTAELTGLAPHTTYYFKLVARRGRRQNGRRRRRTRDPGRRTRGRDRRSLGRDQDRRDAERDGESRRPPRDELPVRIRDHQRRAEQDGSCARLCPVRAPRLKPYPPK